LLERSNPENEGRLQLEHSPIERLLPSPRNARTHGEAQIAEIAGSIRAFGFTNPILAGEDGEVIAGHGRLAGARLLGLADVPVIPLGGLAETQKRQLMLADILSTVLIYHGDVEDAFDELRASTWPGRRRLEVASASGLPADRMRAQIVASRPMNVGHLLLWPAIQASRSDGHGHARSVVTEQPCLALGAEQRPDALGTEG